MLLIFRLDDVMVIFNNFSEVVVDNLTDEIDLMYTLSKNTRYFSHT